MGWIVRYTNQGKTERTKVWGTREKAEESAEFLRQQGAKRVRIGAMNKRGNPTGPQKRYRIFNGKRYAYAMSLATKSEAKKLQEDYKKKGFQARVIKGKKYWRVYSRSGR